MAESSLPKSDFLNDLYTIVEKNMASEQFGVSELAEAMNMSRSNLLRKVKKETDLSVSQLISQSRLKRAMELLRTTSLNVSEVSHHVGFNSTSYFIKCFREYYGYPPGEAGKHKKEEISGDNTRLPHPSPYRKVLLTAVPLLLIALAVAVYVFYHRGSFEKSNVEKSIAVLPFKNESNDSTNLYLINGLMEATLNNLQQIKALKVISRTTAEKYRNTHKSIPEIAKELNVNYFVEGSGQKIGDRIVLNIQLIDGSLDKHLWAKQYQRETTEIFALQQEIAHHIADEIKVLITPEANSRIEKKPTDDLVAYDYFLKGKDLFYKNGREDLLASIAFFQKAIERDPQFALAYASTAMAYYYLDMFQSDKKYLTEVSNYADKAMLYDPKSGESLIAKALDYANKKEYEQSIPYFEKALEYNPNSTIVFHFLNEFYSLYVPIPRKHLEYALKKVKAEGPGADSATVAFNYFHLSNALFETGFVDESLTCVNKSLAFNPNGYFSGFFKVYVEYGKHNDMGKVKAGLLHLLSKDTTRFDITQEVGKICYFLGQYKEAHHYYKRFFAMSERYKLDVFRYEYLRMAMVYEKMGDRERAEELVKAFKDYADNDKTKYRNLHQTFYYAYKGDDQEALRHLKLFADEKDFTFAILMLPDEPVLARVKALPQFRSTMKEIENNFWNTHEELEEYLREEGLE